MGGGAGGGGGRHGRRQGRRLTTTISGVGGSLTAIVGSLRGWWRCGSLRGSGVGGSSSPAHGLPHGALNIRRWDNRGWVECPPDGVRVAGLRS